MQLGHQAAQKEGGAAAGIGGFFAADDALGRHLRPSFPCAVRAATVLGHVHWPGHAPSAWMAMLWLQKMAAHNRQARSGTCSIDISGTKQVRLKYACFA